MHRGDLHAAILSAVPAGDHPFQQKAPRYRYPARAAVELGFADGSRATADGVVGADGVHSRVREILLGPERPIFTGRVAHRTVFPAALLGDFAVDTCTKWWGPDRHIVVYPVNPRRDEIYFVTSVPDPRLGRGILVPRGEMAEVQAALAGFHPDVQRLLAACPQVHKWALFERDPLAALERGPDRAARRRLSPDDALHGAGGRQCARRRRRAVALPRRRTPTRPRPFAATRQPALSAPRASS